MSSPAYDNTKSPIKNLQALARALSVSAIAETLEAVLAQIIHRIHTAALVLDGTLTVGGLATLTGGLVGGVQSMTAAGAVNLTTLSTKVATSGAIALTLADGTAGQIKTITMITDGGDATLTPTTKTGFSTITFNDVGDSVILQFHTTKGWMILANNGATAA